MKRREEKRGDLSLGGFDAAASEGKEPLQKGVHYQLSSAPCLHFPNSRVFYSLSTISSIPSLFKTNYKISKQNLNQNLREREREIVPDEFAEPLILERERGSSLASTKT